MWYPQVRNCREIYNISYITLHLTMLSGCWWWNNAIKLELNHFDGYFLYTLCCKRYMCELLVFIMKLNMGTVRIIVIDINNQ